MIHRLKITTSMTISSLQIGLLSEMRH